MKLTDDEIAHLRAVKKAAVAAALDAERCAGTALHPRVAKIKEAAHRRRLPGFFAGLTPEQQADALAYEGPENFGDPDGPRAALASENTP